MCLSKYNKLFYWLLVIGLFTLVSPKVTGVYWLYSLSTFLSLGLFLYLAVKADSKTDLFLICLVLVAGYVVRYIGVTGIVIVDVLVLTLVGIEVFFIFLLTRWAVRKYNKILSTLFFPVLWMTAYSINSILRIPSVMRIDNLFFDMKFLIQAESVIYSFGLSFLILWISTLFVFGVISGNKKGFWLSGSIALVIIAFGIIRLGTAQVAEDFVHASYTTGPFVGDFLNYEVLDIEDYKASYKKSVETAANGGAEMLVFNEEAFEINDVDEKAFLQFASKVACDNDICVLVGCDVDDTDGNNDGKAYNKIYFIDNSGEVLDEYVKYQLIPVLESGYVRGDGEIPTVTVNFHGRDVKVSFAICYDSNFPSYLRKMDKETDILLLPSWDWKGITDLHYRICGTISIDRHLSLLKPTYDGYTIATDQYGRILTLTNTDETGYENVQFVDLPIAWR